MLLSYELCFVGIRELQSTALDNLKSIDEFNETGEQNNFIIIRNAVNLHMFLVIRNRDIESSRAMQDKRNETSQFQNKVNRKCEKSSRNGFSKTIRSSE